MTSETQSARPDEAIAIGTMVGEYAIDGVLGEGGMGKVYAATHPIIAKRAAVKVLHPALSMNQEAVERFVQEARSVNQIGHPNIVDIFAFGTLVDGRSYFVMEYLRGESLRDRLRHSPLKLVEALALLDTVAQALEAAHETGIVHRDLKPDNIFLVEHKGAAPLVKLLDFGIAKLLGGDTGMLTEKTRTGNMLGTPTYMSPEQARGYAVDHRTDIYAFGCVAFELVTGNVPYPSDNSADMIAQHLVGPVPSAGPMVPPELDALLMAMMAKDADARPSLASAREVILRVTARFSYAAGMQLTAPSSAVSPLLTPMPQPTSLPPPARPRSPVLVIGIVATLVVGIGVAMFVLVKQGMEPAAATAPPPTTTKTMPVERPAEPAPAPKPDPVVAKPPVADEAKPVDPVVAKPVEPDRPVEPALAKPDLNQVTKQLGEMNHKRIKGFRLGKRPVAPPETAGSAAAPPKPAAGPDDDDAPMRH